MAAVAAASSLVGCSGSEASKSSGTSAAEANSGSPVTSDVTASAGGSTATSAAAMNATTADDFTSTSGGGTSTAGGSSTDNGAATSNSGSGGLGGATTDRATSLTSGGAGGSGGVPSARFECPPGPFPEPMVLSSEPVCEDFELPYDWNEGPTWVASQNAFFFSNFDIRSPSGGDIIRYTPGGGCERFLEDVGCNGLAISNDGNLLAACQQTRSVVKFDLTTKERTTVVDQYMGTQLDTPNDLVQHSNGSIYFTNAIYELGDRPEGVGPAAFRIDPEGTLNLIGQGNCNGIALSPEEDRLYVLLMGMWDLDADGVPSGEQPMFTGGDGMGVDCAGNVYANGSIFTREGDEIGSWGSGTNLAFGGEDGQTVLVAGRNRDLRVLTVNVPGLP